MGQLQCHRRFVSERFDQLFGTLNGFFVALQRKVYAAFCAHYTARGEDIDLRSTGQCLEGIKSFKRAVYVGNFLVDQDKSGRYRYVLRNIGVAPAFVGESYDSRSQCESCIESVKRFVVSAKIELPEAKEE